MPFRTAFLGLDFDGFSVEAAAATIALRARSGEAFAYVTTPNVDHIVRLSRNEHLAPFYADAWLTLCDSRIVQLLGQWSNIDLPVAAGSDLSQHLFERYIAPHDSIAVVGGSQATVDALTQRYKLRNIQWHNPPHGLRDDPAARRDCARFIRDSRARYVFLAVGSPQQEMIARDTLAMGGATGVALCCGASLEFLSGETARAPVWVQRHRLEWLHRLASNPARLWRRYLVEGPAIFGLWRSWQAAERAGQPLRLVPVRAPVVTEEAAPIRAAG
jgi:N-acetylglucosaminyldiphosphoundecaprenol N-acetyl-beta-D-mannosaminyltransferase